MLTLRCGSLCGSSLRGVGRNRALILFKRRARCIAAPLARARIVAAHLTHAACGCLRAGGGLGRYGWRSHGVVD